MRNPFHSLKYRNFRLYWIGMNLSLIGSWMQTIALPWIALTLTRDPFKVGLVSLAQFLPSLLFTLFSGVLLDRFDKLRILLCAQIGMMIIACIFAFLAWFEAFSFANIFTLSLINGVFTAFDSPSRQALVRSLIASSSELPNAVALNSISFNLARITGPALAGLIMAHFGAKWCFVINAISFLAVIISLFFVKISEPASKVSRSNLSPLALIKQGFSYMLSKKILSEILFIVLILSTFIPNYNITISAFVKFDLAQGERYFGYLMSILGLGALCGALGVASFGNLSLKSIRICAVLVCVICALAGAVASFAYNATLIALLGFFFVLTNSSMNSTVQMHTSNEFRGRIMSIYTLFFLGSTPFGALFAGFFTDKFGAKFGFFISGFCALILLLALFYLRRNKSKPT
ncbi:MFS transporter [Campylobacter sp. VBCF_06 NA8]|uniref:MFS transporter n=1 Tax=Campylobacter sp. VBCF_06 NA8 TaxID=2983822 RepID=UPI0022EA0AD9|nr:MFS transporter [Campylobacter sp. VBCF_06 NA8]MDA3045997.1 MFS transporter [Campylobacter sp. VBCF_06 NA8]